MTPQTLKTKLFALLGLSIEKSEPLLRPDYTESLPETLKRYAAYIVTQLGCLELLYDDRRHEFTDLPSWIPNWYSSVFKRGRLLAPGSTVWERRRIQQCSVQQVTVKSP